MAADAPASGQQQGIVSLALPIVLFIGIFYLMIFRPQKKKQQQHDNMVASITRGDTVISAGGFFGRVCDVMDDSYIIEIAEGVRVRILKSSISTKKDSADGSKLFKHKRKKKRPEAQSGAQTESETSVPIAIEDGITAEESDVLFKEPDEGSNGSENNEPHVENEAPAPSGGTDAVSGEEREKND
jgi:preprotein translocase subunit YajC